MGQFGDDAGEPLVLGSGVDEQPAQDDLATGIEAATFGSDTGIERVEASLGLIDPFAGLFDRFWCRCGHVSYPKARIRSEYSAT